MKNLIKIMVVLTAIFVLLPLTGIAQNENWVYGGTSMKDNQKLSD